MTSITDRLNRDEWNPQPGDTLEGTIVAITERSITTKEDHRELWFPVVTVEPGKSKPGVIVDCGRGGLAGPVIAARPKVGQRIGFRFIGPTENPKTGKTFDKFLVEFEDEAPEPDWDRMAEARGTKPDEVPF
jgi:hypothetical protein